jgi:hypothetical protein
VQRKSSLTLAALVGLALLAFGQHTDVRAQTAAPASGYSKSEVYFGLRTPGGRSIEAADWDKFLSEVVARRFPAGLTVIEGAGRSAGTGPALNPTRIVVLVHPTTAEAQTALREVKAEYAKRFQGAGVFHTEHAVRIVNE